MAPPKYLLGSSYCSPMILDKLMGVEMVTDQLEHLGRSASSQSWWGDCGIASRP